MSRSTQVEWPQQGLNEASPWSANEAIPLKSILLCALLLLPTIPAVAAADDVTVTLQVNAGNALLPGWRDCDVTVPAGSNIGAVLDQAVVDGCILEWSSSSHPGFGRYVTSIDHVGEQLPTYWAFRVDGAYSNTGIDDTLAEGGSTYKFTYEQWAVAL